MKIIDLTKTIYEGMEVYPGDPQVIIEQIHFLESEGWRLRKINLGTHTGTHVDAPAHMVEDGKTLDQIPLDTFIGKAMVVSDLGKIRGQVGLVFPGPTGLEVLEKILEAKPSFVAGDLAIGLEKKLLEAGILTYTDLANLDLLPPDGDFIFIGLPLKIKEADGSPVRAVALIDW